MNSLSLLSDSCRGRHALTRDDPCTSVARFGSQSRPKRRPRQTCSFGALSEKRICQLNFSTAIVVGWLLGT